MKHDEVDVAIILAIGRGRASLEEVQCRTIVIYELLRDLLAQLAEEE